MNEVSAQTVALLFDSVEHRGLAPETLWAGIAVTPAQLRAARRIDWQTWVDLVARVEEVCGADQLPHLFVSGAGQRVGHGFVRLANAVLSVQEVFALFARWGLRRNVTVLTGQFDAASAVTARFTTTIDPTRAGSLPTLRFIAGLLRSLPTLQGLAPATVQIEPGATAHAMTYALTLPRDRSSFGRARRVLRMVGGMSAALDELEQQATEIAVKNVALEQQLAETERAATALSEREEWLRLALDAGRVGIWRWDPTTQRVRLSDELGELLGLPGQVELDAATWTARIHPDDRDRLSQAMREAAEHAQPFELDCRIFRTSGELGWIQVKGRVVSGRSHDRLTLVGTVADLTGQKLLDSQLHFADRLIAAGTLAAGVAHEVNNPLAYVLGNLELIRQQLRELPAVPPAIHERLDQMDDGLERIRNVVTDLRAFARPEEELVARTALRAVCEAAIRIVSSLVRHRAVVITDFADDTPVVLANQSRLGQVMINLMVNASSAMPERPATDNRITVRTQRLPTGEAALEITDNGAGIAPELMPRLFDPFFTTRSDGMGTGLGLSVCHRIVESLHGRIEVESRPGIGSTFTVVLPAAPAQERVRAPTPAPVAATGRRVLVIDDEPVLRRVLGSMLATLGYLVVEASGGRAGLERVVAGEAFDAVLCDLMMPDVDGVAFHAELGRQRPELVAKTVFMSGGAVSQRSRAFVERADIVLLDKPFTLEHLMTVLERLPTQPT